LLSLFLLFLLLSHASAPSLIYTLSLHDALPISSFLCDRFLFACSRSRSRLTPALKARSSRRFSPTSFAPPRAPAAARRPCRPTRSEEHTSELQSLRHLVCRLLLEKKKKNQKHHT